MNNKLLKKVDSLLRKTGVQKASVFAVALLVVGSVAYFGTNMRDSSSAAIGQATLSLSPATGTFAPNADIAVTVKVSSDVADPVNVVQASLTYNAAQLQFVSITEGTAFPVSAATQTGTPGIVRVARSTDATPTGGNKDVLVVNFKVLASSGTAAVSIDPAFSYIVRSTDNQNIMTGNSGASYTLKLPTPTVTAVSPTSGPLTGGTPITVTGTNFVNGATVRVGGVLATSVVFNSATSLSAVTPAGTAGAKDVVVTNPDAQTATRTGGFTYVSAAPTITAVSPTSGPTAGGTRVTVTGTNFVSGATVRVGGVAATAVTFNSATSISATTPAGTAGAKDVVVTNPDGLLATRTAGFTYIAAPTVTSATPSSGLTSGGTVITVAGTNFVNGATVRIGGVSATGVTFVSSTALTATTPAGSVGAKDILVTNPDGQSATRTAGFTYLSPAPTISSVSPAIGFPAGGLTITITGSNFVNGATVTIGGTSATSVTVVSSSVLTARTPARTVGSAAVVVKNPDNQTATLANGINIRIAGDVNGDGRVNAIDLSFIITKDSQAFPEGDFDADGTIGAADMAILLAAWTW